MPSSPSKTVSFRLDAVAYADLSDRAKELSLSPPAAAKELVLAALTSVAPEQPQSDLDPLAKEEQVHELRGQVLALRATLGRVFEALMVNLSDIPNSELRSYIPEVLDQE